MATEVKYIAKHQIPILIKPGKPADKAKGIAAVRPTTKNVMPGEPVMLDPSDENTKFFLQEGAIELAGEGAEKPKRTTKPAKAAKPAASESNDPKAPKDMTVDELKAELNEGEIEFEKDAKKADLVALVEKARADSEPLV